MSKQYTTVSGDTWDSIAYQTLGDYKYTDRLMKANIEYIDYYIFPSGITLNIPDIEELENEEMLSDETLPEWKRGITSE